MKEIDILSLARENVKQMKPYSSARDEFEGAASVFLDANENPFNTRFNRYPDPHQLLLKKVIAASKGLTTSQIFLGNGSDEAIDLLYRVFCNPGVDQVIIPQPTYGMYSVSAAVNDVQVVSIPLTNHFDLDAASVLREVTRQTKLIFLCSPNNPSGNLLKSSAIETILLHFHGIVVIDEAYIDFADSPTWTSQLHKFNNLAVLQTFSKAWGLAGLRLGLCYANPQIIQLLNKVKPPYNINGFTQSEVLQCIQERVPKKNAWVEILIAERQRLANQLTSLPCVKKVFPSDANFLLVEVSNANTIYKELVQQGIIVRNRSNILSCSQCLRITVGTREENDLLIQVMSLL